MAVIIVPITSAVLVRIDQTFLTSL